MERGEDVVGLCAVCLEAFDEDVHLPRLLTCGHSFCSSCLTQIACGARAALECPKCRTPTPLRQQQGPGGGGVHALPRNFDLVDLIAHHLHLQPAAQAAALPPQRPCENCAKQDAEWFCSVCGGHLCTACDDQVHTLPILRAHARVASREVVPSAPAPTCATHRGKSVKFWCSQDRVLVCTSCLLVGAHQGHKVASLEEAADAARADAQAKLAVLEAGISDIERALADVRANELDEQRSAGEARAALGRYFDQVRETVGQRERVLEGQLTAWQDERAQAAREKREELAEAKRRLETMGRDVQAVVTKAASPVACLTTTTVAENGTAARAIAAVERDVRSLVSPALVNTPRGSITFAASESALPLVQSVNASGCLHSSLVSHGRTLPVAEALAQTQRASSASGSAVANRARPAGGAPAKPKSTLAVMSCGPFREGVVTLLLTCLGSKEVRKHCEYELVGAAEDAHSLVLLFIHPLAPPADVTILIAEKCHGKPVVLVWAQDTMGHQPKDLPQLDYEPCASLELWYNSSFSFFFPPALDHPDRNERALAHFEETLRHLRLLPPASPPAEAAQQPASNRKKSH